MHCSHSALDKAKSLMVADQIHLVLASGELVLQKAGHVVAPSDCENIKVFELNL